MATILTVLAVAAGAAQPSAQYAVLVQRYVSGETSAAVATIHEWPAARVRAEVQAIIGVGRTCSSAGWPAGAGCEPSSVWPGLSIPAALMLHTDAARVDAAFEVHDRAALALAQLMAGVPPLADLAERWFGMRARLAREANHWAEAGSWAERGVASFPRSARLRLLLGTIEETLASQEISRRLNGLPLEPDPLRARSRSLASRGKPRAQAASRRTSAPAMTGGAAIYSDFPPPPAESERRSEPAEHLAAAQRALQAALEIEPTLSEARLRLARVVWWRGDLVQAQAELRQIAVTQPGDAGTAFLAQLFLGRVEEDAGQLARALAAYEAAVALRPDCQSARLALSHTRLRLGDPAAARRELETALRSGRSRSRPDPFWLYLTPPAGAAEDELAGLRRELTR